LDQPHRVIFDKRDGNLLAISTCYRTSKVVVSCFKVCLFFLF
jgi:hypothetical protein